ncbi:sprT-like domain-containing protein Spartan isoform X1 [Myotis lucifugus]|uniref:sprT-like domain-containing protein Spartan isoform X1 n=2 Tax=Myotis lucifugus TaxID=59463 RepID=UPI000CCBFA07|nr:sprT-like domain-containing protein Spartan isoform X1 [Myotis lucifugus]
MCQWFLVADCNCGANSNDDLLCSQCLRVTGFQTLLHEMIHAYLFVTNNDKDREGHGPEFCKHMHRINRLTGANITIYHTFHDEVDEYRRHWWRCDGPCQFQKPYYGYVKRATNRAPSAHDYWWAEHQSTCGGTYIKIKEPENYSKKGKGKTKLAAAENKDKTNGVVPFSGRGHVLGETNNLLSSGRFATSRANKTQDPSGPDHSASAERWNAKTEVKFEQNGSRKKTTASPVLHTSRQSVVSNYFPRASVANQKAFRSVSGSPTKGAAVGDMGKSSASSASQRRTSSSKAALRNSLKAGEAMSATASRAEAEPPRKQRRREDKTAFDNFFIKKEKTRSGGGDPQCSSRPAAATPSSSSSTSQSTTVACPVCQGEVLEAQINEHLDVCLEGESSKVKRRNL